MPKGRLTDTNVTHYCSWHLCHDVPCATRLKSSCRALLDIINVLPGAYTIRWKLSGIQRSSRPWGPTTHPSLFRLEKTVILESWIKEEAEWRAWVRSGEKHITGASNTWYWIRNSRSHIRMVLLSDPDMMYLPSGEIATDGIGLMCPWKGAQTASPVLISHTWTVLSSEPDTMRLPSEEIATVLTQLVWPWRGAPNGSPVPISHTWIVLSCKPDTMRDSIRKITDLLIALR